MRCRQEHSFDRLGKPGFRGAARVALGYRNRAAGRAAVKRWPCVAGEDELPSTAEHNVLAVTQVGGRVSPPPVMCNGVVCG